MSSRTHKIIAIGTNLDEPRNDTARNLSASRNDFTYGELDKTQAAFLEPPKIIDMDVLDLNLPSKKSKIYSK
jgi:hypothetical protein